MRIRAPQAPRPSRFMGRAGPGIRVRDARDPLSRAVAGAPRPRWQRALQARVVTTGSHQQCRVSLSWLGCFESHILP